MSLLALALVLTSAVIHASPLAYILVLTALSFSLVSYVAPARDRNPLRDNHGRPMAR